MHYALDVIQSSISAHPCINVENPKDAKTRSEQEAKQILKARFQEKIKTFHEKKVEIIENNVTIEKKDGKMIATGELILNESVAGWKESSGDHPVPSSEE